MQNGTIEQQVFQRNIGILSEQGNSTLRGATIAIAGVGGDGGVVAERLARLGIGQLRLADPGDFDLSNINRQMASGMDVVDKNKAETVAAEIRRITGNLCHVKTYSEGITPDNVAEFISGANVVIDEIEYTRFDLSVLLHREARRQNKFVFLAVNAGWGANLFIFSPHGMTIEEYCGLPVDAKEETLESFVFPITKFCPILPEYLDQSVIEAVINGADIPGVSPACTLVGSMLAAEAALFLTEPARILPVVPEFINIDLYRRSLYVGLADQTTD